MRGSISLFQQGTELAEDLTEDLCHASVLPGADSTCDVGVQVQPQKMGLRLLQSLAKQPRKLLVDTTL